MGTYGNPLEISWNTCRSGDQWTAGSKNQRIQAIISCGIYRTDGPGLEVRCGFSEDDLLRSQRVPEMGSGRELAEDWRQAALAKGNFVELAGG